MKRQGRMLLILLAVSAIGFFPFSQWVSTTKVGTDFFLWFQALYGFVLLVSVLAFPVLIICAILPRTRHRALFYLLFTVLFVPCCIAGIRLGHSARMAGMRAFARRSQPLISAIQRFEKDQSAPPTTLEDLVPKYLPAVPTTGMMAYPRFVYHTGAEARKDYAGNPWALSVFTPSGGFNFDQILYFPRQNYPVHGYGGSLERVDDWAYVHE
ncbi:MAG: hypothetical protein K2Y37_08170 [Pirellulales bacterium]|nr:hypothetical protein [Pirellulales bacterium]